MRYESRPPTLRAEFSARLLAVLAACACSASPKPEVGKPDNEADPSAPIIHTVAASPEGILVNAYLVETEAAVIAIDSALTNSDATALRTRLNALGKPLRAVLITHGHPDHYNGVHTLLAGRSDVPIYATKETSNVIREHDTDKEAQWRPVFGDEWPTPRSFPTHELDDGETVAIEGLSFTVHHLGAGESHADSYWTLDGQSQVAFVGDVVMHEVHAYVSDGHTGPWLQNLERLRAALGDVKVLYPGHGSPGGLELLDWQAQYLDTYRTAVDSLREGGATLTEAAQQELTEHMTREYPSAALDFLIGLGATAVAAELADAAD